MVSITPIYERDGTHAFKEFFDQRFATERLGQSAQWQEPESARMLGLRNPVDHSTFDNLLRGRSADGSRQLRDPLAHRNNELAWKLTITAPAGLSVLWALAPRLDQALLRHVHFSAARYALHCSQAAINNHDGELKRSPMGGGRALAVAFATFLSGASVEQRPQLETTAFLFNMGFHRDGTVEALQVKYLNCHKTEVQNGYSGMLDTMVRTDFDALVPQRIIDRFTENPQRELQEGIERAEVGHRLKSSELFECWRAQSQSWGWDPIEGFRSLGRYHPGFPPCTPQSPKYSADTLTKESKYIGHSHSH